MNENKNNEARAKLHEEALARRIGEALDQLSPAGAGECPDAELIAAYHERALQPDEISRWENHFADCSRCRKILAVLAASVDVPLSEKEVARLGELVAVAERPSIVEMAGKAKQLRPNRFDWRVRWLAPALGVAAVLALWFAVRPPWHTTGPSENLIAQAPKSEPLPETNALIPRERPVMETQPAATAPAPPPANRIAPGKETEELKPEVARSEAGPQDAKKAFANSGALKNEAVTHVPAIPPPPPPPAPFQAADEAANRNVPSAGLNSPARDKQAAGEVVPEAAQAPTGAATAMSKSSRSIQALSSALDTVNLGTIAIATPSGKILWRAGKGGKIQRSVDAGRTWILQSNPMQQDWTAGSAPADMVCWLVGRNGAIARTTDGEHWAQIASPLQASGNANQLPDWAGITATNAQEATITSSDQKRYRTQDGGQTWQPQ
jgi:hypothetical protein